MKDRRRSCELCNNHATLYCASDSAFLCFNCDSRVHGANFLVARHLRHPLCFQCNSLAAHPINGDAVNISYTCSSCSPDNDDDENGTLSISSSFDSAYSSACVSSTESSATTTKQQRSGSSSGRATSSFTKKKVAGDARFEGTFVNWCEKMGMQMSGGNSAAASHALGFCMGRLAGVPLRVSLAASYWFGVRMTSSLGSTCQNLRRVEMMSGVPARMILAVEAKIRRELMRVRRGKRPAGELEEGWAEC